VVSKLCSRSVADTVDRILELLAVRSLRVFAVIDQQAVARSVGLELRETTLVLFGNPAAGTPVMHAAPLVAIDLPLKVVIWSDSERGTIVSYRAPSALAARYGLDATQVAAFEGINALTDALVAG
jgi:uncharacterized protein (DUF302 family)